MPIGPQKQLAMAQRRQRVAELYLECKTQQAIADLLGVSQSTISTDLKAIEKQWREAAIRDLEHVRAVELAKYDRAEREVWEAWFRSQQPLEVTRVTQQGSDRRAEKRVIQQHGDRHYLELLPRIYMARRGLLGLDAPPQSARKSVDGREPVPHLTLEEALNLYQKEPDSIENDPIEQRIRGEQEGKGPHDATESDGPHTPP